MSKKILIVEDEINLGNTLCEYLEELSYEVQLSTSYQETHQKLNSFYPHLILMDITLPDGSGLDLAKEILQEQKSPPAIIFLSAMNAPETRLQGYEIGAYDYINKPFSLKELTLRLNNVFSLHQNQRIEKQTFGNLKVDLEAFQVIDANGKVLDLSLKECLILKLLLEKRDQAVAREEIIEKVWGEDQFPSNRTVDNYIVKLRKWCETDPLKTLQIQSIRGVGYKLHQVK